MPYGLRGLADAPLGIVATMPPLPASACTAGQTYIPPGGKFTSGSMAGQITATGACQDGNVPPSSGGVSCFKLFGNMESCIGPIGSMTLFAGVGLGLLLWAFGGKR